MFDDLPSITLLKDLGNTAYYRYVGRVEVRQIRHGPAPNYVVIVDRETGDKLCEIKYGHEKHFLSHEGEVAKFVGILDKYQDVVTPHI